MCICVQEHVCMCVCMCVWHLQSTRSQTIHCFSDKLHGPFKLPKPERWPWAGKYCQEAQEVHNQASLRTQFSSHWQLITVSFLIPEQQNNPPKPCDPLGQAQKLQSSLVLHQQVHIEKPCLGELWIVFTCFVIYYLWSNISGKYNHFLKEDISPMSLSKKPVLASHLGLIFCLLMCFWDHSITYKTSFIKAICGFVKTDRQELP